jgi:hypothetical protein
MKNVSVLIWIVAIIVLAIVVWLYRDYWKRTKYHVGYDIQPQQPSYDPEQFTYVGSL